jgi:hypothetical protein
MGVWTSECRGMGHEVYGDEEERATESQGAAVYILMQIV